VRPRHEDVDEVAVARCAAGTLRHTTLTWAELEQVVRRLERWLTDAEIDRRLGAADGLLQTTRRRQGWPRRSWPAAALTDSDVRRILGRPARASTTAAPRPHREAG